MRVGRKRPGVPLPEQVLASGEALQDPLVHDAVILELLKQVAADEGKRLDIPGRLGDCEVDAWASEGFEDLKGPTAIQVRRPFESFLAPALTRQMVDRLVVAGPQYSLANILLIVPASLTTEERDWLDKLVADNRSIVLRVWDREALRQRAVRTAVTKGAQAEPGEWENDRKKRLAEVQRCYRDNDLVLVLGAGVSKSAGMPEWNTLLSRLLVAMIHKNLPETLDTTETERTFLAAQLHKAQEGNALLEARYIRAGLKNEFEAAMAQSLYKEVAGGAATSDLLKAIARLCMPRRSGPGLREVITYNFDELMEQHLSDAGIPHRAIFQDGETADPDELRVFHVHGFLPRDAGANQRPPERLLVFSEERYHSLMLDPYSWANLVQLAAFRDHSCLLIGLSLTDPNLRRLLEVAAKSGQAPRHYVVLLRLTPEQFLPPDGTLRPEVAQAFVSAHHQLLETSLRELGLNVIWVKDHAETPRLIGELTERRLHATA